jgi:hypothetical protein
MVEQKQVQPQMNKKLQEDRAAEKQKLIEERRKRLEEDCDTLSALLD